MRKNEKISLFSDYFFFTTDEQFLRLKKKISVYCMDKLSLTGTNMYAPKSFLFLDYFKNKTWSDSTCTMLTYSFLWPMSSIIICHCSST